MPNAKKPRGRHNPRPTHQVRANRNQVGKSQAVVSQFRDPEGGVTLSEKGKKAYDDLVASLDIDLGPVLEVEEKRPGDREKIVTVMRNLALGAKHRDAFADVDWTWSHFSYYRVKFPKIQRLYEACRDAGESYRRIVREDEAHRRAVEGWKEEVYSIKGEFVGYKVKYSDTLLAMFLKADNPDKFMERHEVKQTGVVLNVNMSLRDDVPQEPMKQSEGVEEVGDGC